MDDPFTDHAERKDSEFNANLFEEYEFKRSLFM